jgi:hypothetical protein
LTLEVPFIIDGIQTYNGYTACVGNARYEKAVIKRKSCFDLQEKCPSLRTDSKETYKSRSVCADSD